MEILGPSSATGIKGTLWEWGTKASYLVLIFSLQCPRVNIPENGQDLKSHDIALKNEKMPMIAGEGELLES